MGRKHGTWTSQESVSLTTFADATDAYKPLSFAEEQALGHRIQAGDMDAAEQLVLHNMKFCLSYARKFTGRGVPMDDLVASAYTGMIKASRRFKPGHGKFISYAVWEMKSHMQRCISTESAAVCYPQNAVSYQAPVLRFFNKHNAEGGGVVLDAKEVSEGSGVAAPSTKAVMGILRRSLSLSHSGKDISGYKTEYGNGAFNRFSAILYKHHGMGDWSEFDEAPVDRLVDTTTPLPDACAETEDRRRVIGLIIRGLTPRQRYVVEEVYLKGKEPIEVARALGVTRQAVFSARDKAFSKARRNYGRLMAQGVL